VAVHVDFQELFIQLLLTWYIQGPLKLKNLDRLFFLFDNFFIQLVITIIILRKISIYLNLKKNHFWFLIFILLIIITSIQIILYYCLFCLKFKTFLMIIYFNSIFQVIFSRYHTDFEKFKTFRDHYYSIFWLLLHIDQIFANYVHDCQIYIFSHSNFFVILIIKTLNFY
jgi:hypothetical protein